MIRHILPLLTLCLGLIAGCSSTPPQKPSAIDVTGTVTGADGKPLGNVKLNFLPTNADQVQLSVNVAADGKFQASVVPGKYTFSFEPQTGKQAAFKGIPANYTTNEADHSVVVEAGKPVSITIK